MRANGEIPTKEIKKILIVQLAGIGDLVMATPTLKALRTRFKDAFIGLFVISRSAELIRGCPDVDNLFVLDIQHTDLMELFRKGNFIKIYKTIKELHQQRFDMLINLEHISSWVGAFKMAIIFWLIGAKYKVGRDTDGKGFFFNFKVKETLHGKKHTVESNLDVARLLGADVNEVKLEVPIFEEDIKFVSNFLAQYGVSGKDLLIGLNPGTFCQSRRWFEKYWSQLADRLFEKYDCKIIITGHSSERKMINNITGSIGKKSVIVATDLNLKQITALIKRLNLFITNDTGPMHIAVATETPLIGLFGPSDIYKFSPYYKSDRYSILRKEVDCPRPCDKIECEDRKCMELITPGDVMKQAERTLG
ncbi:MAG: glycosyltransferase family 9 protein [bacterium]